MTPAERIAAALQAANNPSAYNAGLPPSAVERRTARIVIEALCMYGERVVLDRTGDTDRLLAIDPVLGLASDANTLAAEDGFIVYQGPGTLYEIYEPGGRSR